MTRYCIYCGQPADKKAINRFVCANNHENWLNAAPCAAAIILRDEKMLFGKRLIEPHAGGLAIPGGFLELNESFEQALLREVKEETNIDAEIISYFKSYATDYSDVDKPVVVAVYLAAMLHDDIQLSDDLGGEPIWRSLNDLPTKDELSWSWQMELMDDLRKWHAEHGAV